MMMLIKKSATRKLDLHQVQEMRKYYGEGATQGALARHYGVSVGQVGRIVRGESWVEGAGDRLPTQAEQDGILQRLLQAQERVNIAPELVMTKVAAPAEKAQLPDDPRFKEGGAFDFVLKKAPVNPMEEE